MSAEVKLQVLQIIQLSGYPKALDKGGVFFFGQMNLTFVLHHFHNTREPLFQIRNLLLNFIFITDNTYYSLHFIFAVGDFETVKGSGTVLRCHSANRSF